MLPDEETRTGRPRDPSRDEAILAATLDLLGEVGFEHVTVRAIAQRAGAGLATIYRRWPTKEDLVVDAVGRLPHFAPPSAGADPVEALVGLLTGILELLQGPRRGLIPNLVGQLPHNPALAEALRNRLVRPRLAILTEQVAAISGLEPECAPEIAELIPASLFFQVLVLGRRLTAADVRRLLRTLVPQAPPSRSHCSAD
jgi:AcrR family transcriptional regulator